MRGRAADEQVGLFVTHLITVTNTSPATANQYISHVVKSWIDSRTIRNANEVRTPYLASIIAGFERKARVGNPIKDKASIPLTYPLLLEAVKAIDKKYAGSPAMAVAMKAAFALGYGCSLRPGEYLKLQVERELDEQVCAGNIGFWWGDTHIPASKSRTFPKRNADRMTLAVDFLKNDQRGKGLPRALARAPSPTEFDCMIAIEKFVRSRELDPARPLLTTSNGQIKWTEIRIICNEIAITNKLDTKRLLPRSMRAGAVNQLDACNHTSETMERQGGWQSTGGMRSYLRSDFRHADLVSGALHDVNAIPIAHTRHMFTPGGGFTCE